MNTSLFEILDIYNIGYYDETNTSGITVNYKGLYYIDFGEYPQTSEGTVQPAGTIKIDESPYGTGTEYYLNNETQQKYVKKSNTYYKVEPVRWLIIGNGYGLNDIGFPDKNFDNLGKNQLLLLSEKTVLEAYYYQSDAYHSNPWISTTQYSILSNSKNLIFNVSERNLLDTFNHDNSQLCILSYDWAYKYYNYCSENQLKSSTTNYSASGREFYWLAMQDSVLSRGMSYAYSVIRASGTLHYLEKVQNVASSRPIIILNI